MANSRVGYTLPFDIYLNILLELPISKELDSVLTLIRCSEANSILRSAATLSWLWKPHYQARYTHCNAEREAIRRSTSRGDWRLMYLERLHLDSQALTLLDRILLQRRDRQNHARSLVQRFSFDVWDVLALETQCTVPKTFRMDARTANDPETPVPHALPRRYWAEAMLGVITRHYAVNTWGRLFLEEEQGALEDVLAGLSAFFGHSPFEIISNFDTLAHSCRDFLSNENVSLVPQESRYNLAHVCTKICEFLRLQGFSSAQDSSQYFDIFNHFPHSFLTTHKCTIPLPLVCVFIGISRRLGIQASPVDFPGRVIACVSSPLADDDDIYVDVFGSETQPILSADNGFPPFLVQAGVTTTSILRSFRPSPAYPILFRCCLNVVAASRSQEVEQRYSAEVHERALYAISCVLIYSLQFHALPTFTRPHLDTLSLFIQSRPDTFPLDAGAVFLDGFVPSMQLQIMSKEIETRCHGVLEEDQSDAAISYRHSEQSIPMKYRVGMFFEDNIYRQSGCIIGWAIDPLCDIFPHDSGPPYYHAFLVGGSRSSKIYISEANVKPTKVTQEIVQRFFATISVFKRHFEDAEPRASDLIDRMIPSPELLSMYPEG